MKFIFILNLLMSYICSSGQNLFSPSKEALKLFNQYKPTIEKNNEAIVDEPEVFIGDINNDKLEDCIIFFVMTSKEGGNAIIRQDAAIYLNTGKKMRVVGGFNLDICYGLEKIQDNIIYINEYKCEPPYDSFIRKRKYVFQNNKIVQKK